MTNPLEGRLSQKQFNPHENYDYDNREVRDTDHFVFKRGKEAVHISLAHPHVEELQESNPRFNEETIFGDGLMNYGSQHTLWDKPYGRSRPATITGLYATPGAKADVGTALGVVVNHAMKRFGHIPDASDNLSKHSVPIVERVLGAAKEKGISGTEKMYNSRVPRNDIVQDEGSSTKNVVNKAYEQPGHKEYYHNIPQEHIEAGSKLIRGLFAGRHLNKGQFTQQELPFHE